MDNIEVYNPETIKDTAFPATVQLATSESSLSTDNTYYYFTFFQIWKSLIDSSKQISSAEPISRLKLLVKALLLRREKSDKKPDGSALVAMPKK